jgi:hypothetical protein
LALQPIKHFYNSFRKQDLQLGSALVTLHKGEKFICIILKPDSKIIIVYKPSNLFLSVSKP